MSATPDWWSTVEIDGVYTNTDRSWVGRISSDERKIRSLVATGVSPSQERKRFIKNVSVVCDSKSINPVFRRYLQTSIAVNYASMGDYKRAAKTLAEILNENPNYPDVAELLSVEYEHVGDEQSAVRMYKFLFNNFKQDPLYGHMAESRIALLKGNTCDFNLKKPDWWYQFQGQPDWWNAVSFSLPALASYREGVQFLASSPLNDPDKRKYVKASVELAKFLPLALNEQMDAIMRVAAAYERMGDHHRCIESAWIILEKYSADRSSSLRALKLIKLEFNKLGEVDQSKAIQNLIKHLESAEV